MRSHDLRVDIMAQRSCPAPENPGLKISPEFSGKTRLEDKNEGTPRGSEMRSWISRDSGSTTLPNNIKTPINRLRLQVRKKTEFWHLSKFFLAEVDLGIRDDAQNGLLIRFVLLQNS
jgi:hypothetical protein